MIRNGPKIFMIISLFWLRQHFSMMALIFIQNFGNYSFVWNCWTVYCLRIHYHLFESDWVVLSKYQKIMGSLQFIFCWSKHVFLMIIKIFIEKHFSSNFWTADSLNMVHPSFFSFLRELHPDNILVANKYTKSIKWGWMMPHDIFFL